MAVGSAMNDYTGVIIEESLEDPTVLSRVHIVATRVEPVTEGHKTPWVTQWTLHTVEIPATDAAAVATDISKAIDADHAASWYADFKNDHEHFVVFRDRVFRIDRTSQAQYDEARQYGLSIGLPVYQLDFQPEKKQWER